MSWRIAITACLLLVGCIGFSASKGNAQQPNTASEEELGIIVTPTAEQAQEVLKELKAGMDFGVVAREHSIDSTAADGGYMGRMNPQQLRADLRDGLSGVKPGELSGVVKTPQGFAVLTVFHGVPNRPDLDKKRLASLGSSVAVRQSVVVSGNGEAKSVFDQFTKPKGWERDLAQPCAIRRQSLQYAIQRMHQLLAEAAAQPAGEVPPRDLLEGYTALAELDAYVGEMNESIDSWKSAGKIALTNFPDSTPYLLETIGVSYLHLAEMENGVYHNPSSLDIFPPMDASAHFEKQEHSQMAIQYFQSYLDKRPDDMEVRWLLNLTYVTLGQYPAGVPPQVFDSCERIRTQRRHDAEDRPLR